MREAVAAGGRINRVEALASDPCAYGDSIEGGAEMDIHSHVPDLSNDLSSEGGEGGTSTYTGLIFRESSVGVPVPLFFTVQTFATDSDTARSKSWTRFGTI
jgi:hypothetical protein